MGFGDQSKKDKAADKAAAAQAAADKAAEDAAWSEGGKKANKKAEAAAERAAAKADRKAAADEQAAAEDAEMATPRTKGKGKGKEAKPKMTQAEIAAKAMAALKAKEKEAKQKKIDIEKSGGNEYIGVLRENDNKSKEIDGSGIDGAINALEGASIGGSSSGGPPKKVNMKALYAYAADPRPSGPRPERARDARALVSTCSHARLSLCVGRRSEFEEREIARLKDENPGLKLSQLKERAFNAWQKSPDNPKNQESAVDVS